MSLYRTLNDIESKAWGGVLVIDPNGVRAVTPGPHYYLLDNIVIRPGLTDKTGVFTGELSDMAKPGKEKFWIYRVGSGPLIRDNDEFMVGVQRGPDAVPSLLDTWDPAGGPDGKGSGRVWLLGGYITQRSYSVDQNSRIVASMSGIGYMDVWKDQPFGIPTNPANYQVATDLKTIADDLFDAVNLLQPINYRYTKHGTYWPAVILGIDWLKEFRQEAAFNVIQDICNRANYDWRIDARKQVLLYPRGSITPGLTIDYTKITEAPELMVGDLSEYITHIILTDGSTSTMPPDLDGWCRNPAHWMDLAGYSRKYHAASVPAPPSPGCYVDATMVIDDEGHPALCFEVDLGSSFNLHFGIHAEGGSIVNPDLGIDLREWRRLRFRFRHVTRTGVGNIYRIGLHTNLNDTYFYDFGTGWQETYGLSDHDTIDDPSWTEIDLLLPEIDVDGNPVDLNGWIELNNPDPTDIGWVHLYCLMTEVPMPGEFDYLSTGSFAGDRFIAVNHPERFGGFPSGYMGFTDCFQPPFCTLTHPTGSPSEEVRIRAISVSGIPLGYNIELDSPLQNTYPATSILRLKLGKAIAFSQFRFERNLRYEETTSGPLPPYRYRMSLSKEMESLAEAQSRAESILAVEGTIRQWAKVNLKNDPSFIIGQTATVNLDEPFFSGRPMVIDDIEYRVDVSCNLEMALTLATTDMRHREVNQLNILEAHDKKITNLGLEKNPLVKK